MLKKLSLAALIAMGSMSVATATPLTEAIKGVNLSGNIKVKFENNDNGKKESKNKWATSGDFKFTVPVNENLKVVYKIGAKHEIKTADDELNDKGNSGVKEKLAYLNYSVNGLDVVVGKIPVGTSVTDDDAGTGIIATYKVVDQLTVAAGWVDAIKTDDWTGNDIYTVGALFNIDMVKGNIWYYQATNLLDSLYTLSVDVKPVDLVTLHADYAAGKVDIKGAETKTYFNISAEGSFEEVSVKAGYASTNDKDGVVVLNDDAPISDVLPTKQKSSIANSTDTTAIYIKGGYKIDSKANVYVAYSTIDQGKDAGNEDFTEIALGGSYKYTKKMKFSAYYSILSGSGDAKEKDNNKLSLEAKYSF